MHTAGSESSECLCNQQFRTGNAKASLGKAAGQYSILLPKAAPNEERKLCASIAMGSPTSQSAGVYPGQREFRVSLHQEFRSWNPWSHHQLKQEKNQSEKPVLPISPRDVNEHLKHHPDYKRREESAGGGVIYFRASNLCTRSCRTGLSMLRRTPLQLSLKIENT